MGRKNKKYQRSLHQQAYDKLVAMQCFGQSKRKSKQEGGIEDKIFSFSTYSSYFNAIKRFLKWLQKTYPEITSLKKAARFCNEWVAERIKGYEAGRISAWTIAMEASALTKLFGADAVDRSVLPKRRRVDIKRSRGDAERDSHFSKRNNDFLIKFCEATGCRRNVLEKLTGDDLWTRERMEEELSSLKEKIEAGLPLSEQEETIKKCIHDALTMFPEEDSFVYHRGDKGGKSRLAPIIAPDEIKEKIIQRFKETEHGKKVWLHVHDRADIHGYRGTYCGRIYRKYARDYTEIPFDRKYTGSSIPYKSEVFYCRKDEKGRRLDKRAMEKCTFALGHQRLNVISTNYLYDI